MEVMHQDSDRRWSGLFDHVRWAKVDFPLLRIIADRFGVRLSCVADTLPKLPMLNGPTSQAGLSIEDREVFYVDRCDFHTALHEIMHVVTNPPGFDIEVVPEDFMLMQFERAVAKIAPPRLLSRVIDWQLETASSFIEPTCEIIFAEIDGYENEPGWTAGLQIARCVGILDENNDPTWANPRWDDAMLARMRTLFEVLRHEGEDERRSARSDFFGWLEGYQAPCL